MTTRSVVLEGLHHWARRQQFSPPWWLRQPDLQTSWYVIREIGAGLRDGRLSPREIWQYILGQQRDGPAEKRNTGRGASINLRKTPPATGRIPRNSLDNEQVEIPLDSGGFLTGVLNRVAVSRRIAILFHGLEGSVEATYMRGTARTLLCRGIAALRVNMINCGGSEACTRLFYHAGFALMVEVTVQWALEQGFDEIAIVGFSLGGNLVLRYLGNHRRSRPAAVRGGVAVSTPIDLARSVGCIDRPRNRFYRYRFLKSMYRTFKRKQELFPDLFPRSMEWVKTIEEFDHRYTAPANGFSTGSEYYSKASSLPYLCDIDCPTVILQSQDDIFIPFETFQGVDWKRNRNLIPLFPQYGGHLGFHASARENWMEQTIARFCESLLQEVHDGSASGR